MMRPTYKPELSGGTHLAVDLVKDFIKAGHQLELITPIKNYYINQIDNLDDECVIHRITSRYQSNNVISRILRYIDLSRKMYKCGVKVNDIDLIMTHSMPPLLGVLGARLGKNKNIKVLYWEQDVVSESLLSTGIFGKNKIKQKILHYIAKKIELYTEKNSSHVITICNQFKKMHVERGIEDTKIDVVYNWIDGNQVYHVERDKNELFDEFNIPRNKFIVSYCGNLGVPQNVEIMIEAAEELRCYDDIIFVIFGGGTREEIIKKIIEEKNLPNLKLYPLQPLERSHLVYSIGDVGLVIGKAGTSKNGFPSKTWSIMAAEQAMISCFDLDSELSQFVRDGKCGLAIKPDSKTELMKAILELYNNRDNTKIMGKNARKYVIENFSRQSATKKIIKIAEDLIRVKTIK